MLSVFLAGYVPQYLQVRNLKAQTQTMERRLQATDVKDVLALAYLETNRKNYGTAREYSTQFFSRAGEAVKRTDNAQWKATLERALKRRDEITAGLTQGEGAVRDTVEAMYLDVHQAASQVQ